MAELIPFDITSKGIEGVLLVILGIGLIANTFNFYLFLVAPQLRTLNNYLVLNLGLADWLFCLVCAIQHIITFSTAGEYLRSGIGCQVFGFFSVFCCSCQLTSLALVALERYWSIVKRRQLEARWVWGLNAAAWVWATFLSVFPFMVGKKFVLKSSGAYCTGDWADHSAAGVIYTLLSLLNISMALAFFSFVYLKILLAFRETKKSVASVAASSEPVPQPAGRTSTIKGTKTKNQQRKEKLELQLAIRSAILVATFIICWFPEDVHFFYELFSGKPSPRALDGIGVIGLVWEALLNPILFILVDQRWKAAAWKLLGWNVAGEENKSGTLEAGKSGNSISGSAMQVSGTVAEMPEGPRR